MEQCHWNQTMYAVGQMSAMLFAEDYFAPELIASKGSNDGELMTHPKLALLHISCGML